ncbi:hypothetical protein V8C42DRAFT_324205 [Trichoderma barbatum]
MDSTKQPKPRAIFDDWPNLLDVDSLLTSPHLESINLLPIAETPLPYALPGVNNTVPPAVTARPPLSQQHKAALASSSNGIDIPWSSIQLATTWNDLEQFDSLTAGGQYQFSGYPHPETGAPSKMSLQAPGNVNSRPDQLPLDSDLPTPSKVGKRFPSRLNKILRTWLAEHAHHPYPSVEDIEVMQKQMGLSRQQIVTWFGNARRRLKTQPGRPSTPIPFSLQVDKAQEQDLSLEEMNPLQRWQNSPPEHEPAAASAIAKAVRGLPVSDGHPIIPGWDDSSASSAVTSKSSNSSLGSAWSDGSHRSGELFDHRRKSIKRRRRRALPKWLELDRSNPLQSICHTYQCTFCTETFKTKHNWQRHEKSLHLSLEQWKCSPQGPTVQSPDSGKSQCAYCGQINPSLDHISEHNYAACQHRDVDERTFYRKDHLQQHLKLVHNSKFMSWPMEQWKQEIATLRSRCGFCELIMGSWIDRTDHLAEHFKEGQTMASWIGDWGFDSHVLDMVENSMPPYLIHYERNSPWPFTTQQGPVETPINAFELIKLELDFWVNNINGAETLPTNEELQYEACCIILGSEMLSTQSEESGSSWLRELLMSSDEIVKQARIRPMKTSVKARITQLKIHGKGNIFENCSAEDQLQKYVNLSLSSGLMVGHAELQFEASNIIASLEASATKPSPMFVRFLNDLIFASNQWLAPFRARSHLQPGGGNALEPPKIFQSIAAHTSGENPIPAACLPEFTNDHAIETTRGRNLAPGKLTPYLQDDSNCYRRLTRELSRFVVSAVSPHNPSRHIPSDEELQYQARWIMFEEGDPWNQTPADNRQWLENFKLNVGLIL